MNTTKAGGPECTRNGLAQPGQAQVQACPGQGRGPGPGPCLQEASRTFYCLYIFFCFLALSAAISVPCWLPPARPRPKRMSAGGIPYFLNRFLFYICALSAGFPRLAGCPPARTHVCRMYFLFLTSPYFPRLATVYFLASMQLGLFRPHWFDKLFPCGSVYLCMAGDVPL